MKENVSRNIIFTELSMNIHKIMININMSLTKYYHKNKDMVTNAT